MKYVVVSPNNQMICFDHEDQVAEYCMEQDNIALNNYYEDQELEYENMTPVEIGYGYAAIGAESGGCKIFQTTDIINKMKEYEIDDEWINEINDMFNNKKLHRERLCPGYLTDVMAELTPIDIALIAGNVYTCTNLDSNSENGMYPGV